MAQGLWAGEGEDREDNLPQRNLTGELTSGCPIREFYSRVATEHVVAGERGDSSLLN